MLQPSKVTITDVDVWGSCWCILINIVVQSLQLFVKITLILLIVIANIWSKPTWRSVQIDQNSELSVELGWSSQKLTKLTVHKLYQLFLLYQMINFKLEYIQLIWRYIHWKALSTIPKPPNLGTGAVAVAYNAACHHPKWTPNQGHSRISRRLSNPKLWEWEVCLYF